jgi:predicted dehydrogenase
MTDAFTKLYPYQQDRLLNVVVVGCGPIAQNAHFDAIRKAKNARVYGVCDLATDLADRMGALTGAEKVYYRLADALADPRAEAFVIAVADAFHVPLAAQILAAGKHVLVEKPLGLTVEECESLRPLVAASGALLAIGNNRRFVAGVERAKAFIDDGLGSIAAYDGWYYDSHARYTVQDNLFPVPVASKGAVRPAGDQKANRQRYILTTHSPHALDLARHLAGPIEAVRARHRALGEQHAWSVELEFTSGALGHLSLISPRRGAFEEGFKIAGAGGSIESRLDYVWHQQDRTEIFRAATGAYERPLGPDNHSFKKQIEAFAATILDGAPQRNAGLEDGIAAVRAMVAISLSAGGDGRRVALAEATGGVVAEEIGAEGGAEEIATGRGEAMAAD